MRKMKKINGYLVVRFNDREKQGYPQLGSFGVIDSDLYTGSIDIDLDAFEYNDAETVEIAVEQARGLDAEQDFSDEPPIYTVTVETAEEVKEEEVEPKLLVRGWEAQLETQIKSDRFPYVTPHTAAHELVGYKAALYDLGLLDESDTGVDLARFGAMCAPSGDGTGEEEALAYICDNVCRFREAAATQEQLDAFCEKCEVGRWHPARDQPQQEAEPERDTFLHLPANLGADRMVKRLYSLGRVLGEDCPGNDCQVYRNIFRMAVELDEALDTATGTPALVLRSALHERVKELSDMYAENFAIQKFKEGMKP